MKYVVSGLSFYQLLFPGIYIDLSCGGLVMKYWDTVEFKNVDTDTTSRIPSIIYGMIKYAYSEYDKNLKLVWDNIIGDYDAVMKISIIEEAHVIQKPLLSIRIHGENFSDRHRKMSFKEFKKWYFFQERDSFFNKNKFSFQKKLLHLFIVSITPKFLKDLLKKK